MFFNKEPFPANESDENAHNLCTSVEEAKKYCPKRWETMEKWFAEARRVRVYLRASILAILHTHDKKRIPEINVKQSSQEYTQSNTNIQPSHSLFFSWFDCMIATNQIIHERMSIWEKPPALRYMLTIEN